ncbi:hypothetical protein JAAARDRAFT_211450 [Jaapia argillacea MUCL 33604]|uniref:AAA+ ATPase domain-containing protein n=1 Tax=Jaapia argillacea MUCL 33604 TaxID=933084 RepID=A0A067PK92_9AGAM|nr:hypothetical protein JAAARDRAFT_211450 [Jaapia argillacea MUCL 33604]
MPKFRKSKSESSHQPNSTPTSNLLISRVQSHSNTTKCPSLSATNLATYHHLSCDLYLHSIYHASDPDPSSIPILPKSAPTSLALAQFTRGLTWESHLFSTLDSSNLLLTVHSHPLTGLEIADIISFDDRDHFFVAGLTFWPPQDKLEAEFRNKGSTPVRFGLAKPDLVEIRREGDGRVVWEAVDAKASSAVKTSHHVQIFFYNLCLSHLLPSPPFTPSSTAGIWLPPPSFSPSSSTSINSLPPISRIPLSLLSPSLTPFLFTTLPRILSTPYSSVTWHFNPLCESCPFETRCRERVGREGKIGVIPNVSLSDAKVVEGLVGLAKRRFEVEGGVGKGKETNTDIEEIHLLLGDERQMEDMDKRYPSTMRKARRILGVPPRKGRQEKAGGYSPAVEAALTKMPQVIRRRNFTLPKSEDIAVIISLLHDPSTNSIAAYSISIFSSLESTELQGPRRYFGEVSALVPTLAGVIRSILALNPPASEKGRKLGPTTQFHTFSQSERTLLQKFLIDFALSAVPSSSSTSPLDSPEEDTSDDTTKSISDIRLCIGALCEGASLLSTSYQPLILSGALLSFLSSRTGHARRSKAELKACAERLGLPSSHTVGGLKKELSVDQLRKAVEGEVERLKVEGGRVAVRDEEGKIIRRGEVGLVPRVGVVKREVERLIALPVAGYWGLKEAYSVGDVKRLERMMEERNRWIYALIKEVRRRVASDADKGEMLVNEAKVLSASFMDVCREGRLKKLFYFQQFEVLSRLTDLWQARIDGCPDAPILEYTTTRNSYGKTLHSFALISGSLEVPADKDRAFFDYILVEDLDSSPTDTKSALHGNLDAPMENDVPLEALFDDLPVSNLVFPLNRFTQPRWLESQHPEVQRGLFIVDVRDIFIEGGKTKVVLNTWGTGGFPEGATGKGRRWRLSPRLVDFNLVKILSTLLELDLKCDRGDVQEDDEDEVPFLQLISNPHAFSVRSASDMSAEMLKEEVSIHGMFRELAGLGSVGASALCLKTSQRRATKRILANRLSVIWGPPGTGKTYTIAASLLRLLQIQLRLDICSDTRQVVFITAMTHAAIEACLKKLSYLMESYRRIEGFSAEWLDNVQVEHVLKGGEHPAPSARSSNVFIYAGTVYQLYNFSKRCSLEADCVIIDEAGQLSLGLTSLVLRSLRPHCGRVIIAGDSEQLAPILTGKYPTLESRLFGSILDCVMHMASPEEGQIVPQVVSEPMASPETSSQISTIVQLTENFRLNPDLGDFISTIYARPFKPQKSQAKHLAAQLKTLETIPSPACENGGGSPTPLGEDIRQVLLNLSKAMSRKPQRRLQVPRAKVTTLPVDSRIVGSDPFTSSPPAPITSVLPISLLLINLLPQYQASNTPSYQALEEISYETHVKGEAAVAAQFVKYLRRCAPEDDIFVATPHRIQRCAVKEALVASESQNVEGNEEYQALVKAMENLKVPSPKPSSNDPTIKQTGTVTVDTVERLQGSEAAFVICLFSHTHTSSASTDLSFLLERRRLNVAISRAKTLCILITSDQVLRPSVSALANEETAKGVAFLRAYEERAWSTDVKVDLTAFNI